MAQKATQISTMGYDLQNPTTLGLHRFLAEQPRPSHGSRRALLNEAASYVESIGGQGISWLAPLLAPCRTDPVTSTCRISRLKFIDTCLDNGSLAVVEPLRRVRSLSRASFFVSASWKQLMLQQKARSMMSTVGRSGSQHHLTTRAVYPVPSLTSPPSSSTATS